MKYEDANRDPELNHKAASAHVTMQIWPHAEIEIDLGDIDLARDPRTDLWRGMSRTHKVFVVGAETPEDAIGKIVQIMIAARGSNDGDFSSSSSPSPASEAPSSSM
jgi:hypothetical protein